MKCRGPLLAQRCLPIGALLELARGSACAGQLLSWCNSYFELPAAQCLLFRVQAADLDHLLAQMGNHPAGKEVRWLLPVGWQGRAAVRQYGTAGGNIVMGLVQECLLDFPLPTPPLLLHPPLLPFSAGHVRVPVPNRHRLLRPLLLGSGCRLLAHASRAAGSSRGGRRQPHRTGERCMLQRAGIV